MEHCLHFPQYLFTVWRLIKHKGDYILTFHIRGKRIEHERCDLTESSRIVMGSPGQINWRQILFASLHKTTNHAVDIIVRFVKGFQRYRTTVSDQNPSPFCPNNNNSPVSSTIYIMSVAILKWRRLGSCPLVGVWRAIAVIYGLVWISWLMVCCLFLFFIKYENNQPVFIFVSSSINKEIWKCFEILLCTGEISGDYKLLIMVCSLLM